MTKRAVCFFLALCVLLLGGCVKYRQIVTVMPDGSGKIQFIFGYHRDVEVDIVGDGDVLEHFSPRVMAESAKGVAAYTEPVRYQQGEDIYYTYTAYFQNINDLSFTAIDVMDEPTSFNFQQADGGAILTVRGGPLLTLAREFPAPGPDDRESIMEELRGLDISEQYNLPGEVEALEHAVLFDHSVRLTLDQEALLNDGAGTLSNLRGKDQYTIRVPELEIDQNTVDAFMAEMAEAVEKWEAKQQADE